MTPEKLSLDVLLKKHDQYTEEGKAAKSRLSDERKQAITALKELTISQGKLCEHSVRYKHNDSDLAPETIAQYVGRLKLLEKLRARLDKLDQQLNDVDAMFGRSAYRDGSGFYGVTDYSQWALLKYGPLCDALGAASVFGAGITYTTIFSAPRGTIGLMCWSFSLFNVGFVITTLIQSLLRCTSNLPLPTKAKVIKIYWLPAFYEVLLHLVLLLAFACVTGAVMLLSVTVLHLPWSPSGDMPSDIVANSDIPFWLAVALSIAVTAGGLVVTIFVGTLYVSHFGLRVGQNDDTHRVDTVDRFL
ncbi:hypothetical protein HYDPIDRAFT_37698 [Hydnomerulius pinastri MD-312]|nr:hypothetical protein HYDPIDRAFT_37698 [Hydnomerulius pinastri MD-312]